MSAIQGQNQIGGRTPPGDVGIRRNARTYTAAQKSFLAPSQKLETLANKNFNLGRGLRGQSLLDVRARLDGNKITMGGSNQLSKNEAAKFEALAQKAYRGHEIGRDASNNLTITQANQVAQVAQSAPPSMQFGMPGVAPKASGSGVKNS